MTSLLRVLDIESGYGDNHVVNGVDLNVEQGEIVAIIGANGAGKSTLLHTIAGLLRPRKGVVELNGLDITAINPARAHAIGLEYVPQVRNIFPTLTVYETLRVCCRHQNFREAVAEIIELFPRLGQRLHRRTGLLSGGERQMIAIARALINRPFHLLMMDEPSAGLSVDNVRAIFDRIAWIRKSGISVLLVEQNATKALEISDRAYVMGGGKILAEDTGAALLNSNTLRAHYLGAR